MRKYTKILASVLAVACVAAGTSAMGLSAATAGDVDLDGTLGVTDIIALQKYLLGTGKLSGEGARNADVYADGAVNVFDLGMLKRMVLNGQTVEPTEPTQPSEEPTSEPTTEPTHGKTAGGKLVYFGGWTETSNNGKIYSKGEALPAKAADPFVMPASDVTLYAIWLPVQQ